MATELRYSTPASSRLLCVWDVVVVMLGCCSATTTKTEIDKNRLKRKNDSTTVTKDSSEPLTKTRQLYMIMISSYQIEIKKTSPFFFLNASLLHTSPLDWSSILHATRGQRQRQEAQTSAARAELAKPTGPAQPVRRQISPHKEAAVPRRRFRRRRR